MSVLGGMFGEGEDEDEDDRGTNRPGTNKRPALLAILAPGVGAYTYSYNYNLLSQAGRRAIRAGPKPYFSASFLEGLAERIRLSEELTSSFRAATEDTL